MEVPSRFLTPLPGARPSALSPALFPVTEISTLPQLPPWTSRLHPQPDSESLEGKTRLYSLRLWVQGGREHYKVSSDFSQSLNVYRVVIVMDKYL